MLSRIFTVAGGFPGTLSLLVPEEDDVSLELGVWIGLRKLFGRPLEKLLAYHVFRRWSRDVSRIFK